MFDAADHFEHVEKRLSSGCRTTVAREVDGPHFSPTKENWRFITLNLRIEWPTGEVLEVGDYWRRGRRNDIGHTFQYHFMEGDNFSCIFRFDTEGEEIPYDGICHLHVGPDQTRFDDDDSQLHGFGLRGVTFVEVFKLVHLHLNNKPMPWDDPK
jgi:hypothetical protein